MFTQSLIRLSLDNTISGVWMNGDLESQGGSLDMAQAEDEDQVREMLVAVSFEDDVFEGLSLDPLGTCNVCGALFGTRFGFKVAWDHCCFWPDHVELRHRVINLVNSVADEELMGPAMMRKLLDEFGFKTMPDLSHVDPKAPPPGKPAPPRQSLEGCKSELDLLQVPEDPDINGGSSSTSTGDMSPPRRDGIHYLADKDVREAPRSGTHDKASGSKKKKTRSHSRKASRRRSRNRSRDRSRDKRNKRRERSRGRRHSCSRSAGRTRRARSRSRRR